MNLDSLELVLRWLHILSAIAAVGGLVFIRAALLPALATLDEMTRLRLHDAMRARWSRVVAVAILLLLASGLVNFIRLVQHYDLGENRALYHGTFGVKFLLALVVFFISSVITGRSGLAERFRKRMVFWVNLNLTLAIVVVLLSGVLRAAGQSKIRKPAATPVAAAATIGIDEAARSLPCREA